MYQIFLELLPPFFNDYVDFPKNTQDKDKILHFNELLKIFENFIYPIKFTISISPEKSIIY